VHNCFVCWNQQLFNCTATIAVGRTIFYRERDVGMYSALPYVMVISEIPYIFIQTTYCTLIVYTMVGFELITRIPKWWIWYIGIHSVAWTMYRCIVSQYGDVDDTIKVPGMSIDPKIKDYITDHFGYNPNFMGLVATVLVGFAVFFAFVYLYSIKTMNFQRR
ncbi:hypothetical protein EJD97_013935, partial [Solanum chilense]